MECANCRKERLEGREYSFHYGNQVMETERLDIDQLATIKNITYLIQGVDSAWICNRCASLPFRVFLGAFISLSVVGIMTMIGLSLSAYGDNTQMLLGGAACCGLPWLVAGIYLLLNREKLKTSTGEAHAVRLKKDTLKHQGFNAFFNSIEYQRLKKFK